MSVHSISLSSPLSGRRARRLGALGVCLLLLGAVGASAVRAEENDNTACTQIAANEHFAVELIGTEYLPDETSVWNYAVTWDGIGPVLDRFMLKLCHDADVVEASPAGSWVGYSGEMGLYGIKWNTSGITFEPGIPVLFSVTLDDAYLMSRTKVSLKAGDYPQQLHICGPSKYCTEVEFPPQDLICTLDPCTCETFLSWTNIGYYDLINIRVDGVLVQTLPGSATSTTLTVGTGAHLIEVTGVEDEDYDGVYDHCGEYSPHSGGRFSEDDPDEPDYEDDEDDEDDYEEGCEDDEETDPATCIVVCPELNPASPSALSCTPDPLTCAVDIQWTNERVYTELVLSVDGVPYATLPGDATSFTLTEALVGYHSVCLNGTDACGLPFPEVCCSFSCDDPIPPPVNDLQCLIIDPCDCSFSVSWTNGAADYDAIRIFVDGELITTLPGNARNAIVSPTGGLDPILFPGATSSICIVPERNGYTGDQTCCSLTCEEIPSGAPMALSCDAPPAPECTADIYWLNSGDYSTIEILLDGMLYATLPGTSQSASVAIPELGPHEICVRATTICDELLPDVCCTVECIGPPDPVNTLMCTLDDICTCEFSITWMNGNTDYDTIQVLIDGVLHEELPGTATSLPLSLFTDGPANICLVPERYGLLGQATCCVVDCPGIPNDTVEGLTCTPDPLTCVFTATWSNPAPYTLIEVSLDGAVIATLPGDATSYDFMSPLTGPHQICVTATTICGELSAPACCEIDCTIPPPDPVLDLVCGAVDPCTCTLDLSWTNAEANYDSIQILIDGVLDQTLAGSATTAAIALPSPDDYSLCVIPIRNGVSGTASCCSATCPVTDPIPPTVLECIVDAVSCNATINWMNNSLYSQVEVRLNGIVDQVVPGANGSATVLLTYPGANTLSIVATTVCGVVTEEVSCIVSCPQLEPDPVGNLTCTLADVCTCTYDLSWTNEGPWAYDSIRVNIDGVLVQTLPGSATMTSLSVGAPGAYEICLIPVVNAVDGDPACCGVDCPDVPLLPPNGITATVGDHPTCATVLEWQNNSDYSQIVVSIDGAPVATLPGTSTTATVNLPGPGLRTICLTATTICGVELSPTCIDAECFFPPTAPTAVTCTLTDVCMCLGTVTWMNTEADYDAIEVTVDGVLIATLPGNADNATVMLPQPGTSSVCVTAIRNGLSSDAACCSLECAGPPPVTGPAAVTCSTGPWPGCETTVSWTNTSLYSQIVVTLGGVVIETLPGDATMTTVALSTPGLQEICLIATTICGDEAAPSCCPAECIFPPDPIGGLSCLIDSDPCSGSISWMNGNTDYDSIEVTLDGAAYATLPGGATTIEYGTLEPGPHTFCFTAVRAGLTSEELCCTIDCPLPPPAPTGVQCTIDDSCLCLGTLSWMNAAGDYDAIEIRSDGILIDTLPGSATSTSVSIEVGAKNLCVTAVRNALSSADACCLLECPGPPAPQAPSGLSCTIVNADSCTVEVTWFNPQTYSGLEVLVNGVSYATLAGDATSATVNLMDMSADICVVGTTSCGDATDPACCSVQCFNPFRRGDCNLDGFIDIADGIFVVRFLFNGFEPSSCLDACNFNDDALIDIADTIYAMSYIFLGGTPPPAPLTECGVDAVNPIGCDNFPECDL